MASKMAVSYVPKTFLTKKLDIKHFNFDFLWTFVAKNNTNDKNEALV